MKNYSNRFYQRESIQFNYHFESNVENYYADKSLPLWNRILVYLCIFQMEHKREIFVSNKFLSAKFGAPICSVKYSMGVINKKGFATYTTVTASELKGKHRTINLNYKKLKKLLSIYSWSDSKLDTYEKKFVRNRIITIIRKNKKRNIEMM